MLQPNHLAYDNMNPSGNKMNQFPMINRIESCFGIVQNVSEALLLFEASRQGRIPLITKRLSETNRCYIREGSIFIWEIKEEGMRRWTDGRSWSPSRYHNYFFIYHELDETKESTNKSEAFKVNGLLKRTSSISTIDGRKFQLVNYLYGEEEKNSMLPSILNYPIFKNIEVPINYYYRPKNTLKKNSDEIHPTIIDMKLNSNMNSNISQNQIPTPLPQQTQTQAQLHLPINTNSIPISIPLNPIYYPVYHNPNYSHPNNNNNNNGPFYG